MAKGGTNRGKRVGLTVAKGGTNSGKGGTRKKNKNFEKKFKRGCRPKINKPLVPNNFAWYRSLTKLEAEEQTWQQFLIHSGKCMEKIIEERNPSILGVKIGSRPKR